MVIHRKMAKMWTSVLLIHNVIHNPEHYVRPRKPAEQPGCLLSHRLSSLEIQDLHEQKKVNVVVA